MSKCKLHTRSQNMIVLPAYFSVYPYENDCEFACECILPIFHRKTFPVFVEIDLSIVIGRKIEVSSANPCETTDWKKRFLVGKQTSLWIALLDFSQVEKSPQFSCLIRHIFGWIETNLGSSA